MTESADTLKVRRPSCRAVRVLQGLLLFLVIIASILLLTPTDSDRTFRWFGRLGFPDVKGCKFVRVATGHPSDLWSKQPTNHFIEGFLLSESNGAFVVLTRDLMVRSFTNSPAGVGAHERVGFDCLDLAVEAKSYLTSLQHPPSNTWRRFGERMPERAEVFVMAWGCNRNGKAGESQALFRQASLMCQNIPPGTNWTGRLWDRINGILHRSPRKFSVVQQMQRDLAHAMMWRAIASFGDPKVSREELLHQLQSIVSNYPSSEHVPRAKGTAELLQRMIKEDAMHVSPDRAAISSMPTNQQVAEWIFRLRDQNGQQWSQPGWCDIFMDLRETTNSPAHELVRIGYPAVPQLIAAIDDPTLTRSVGYHRDFYFSHTVLTVGDCAISILRRVTGKSFYEPKTTSSYASKDGGASPTRRAAQEWWAEFQSKGERQSLIDAVELGDDDAPAQARMLADRYPSDALAAIARGAEASKQERNRTRLVEIAAELKDLSVTNFLKREMREAPGLETRVEAARALRDKGHRDSVAAMLREWEQWNDTNPDDGLEELIGFLAGTDWPEAIDALGRDLMKRKVETRLEVIEGLGRGSWPFQEQDETMSPATLAAIETGLVNALDDLEERKGLSGTWEDKSFSDPRICDMAAHFLATRWPNRYVFDLAASLDVREQQRIECQNAWRRAQGLEPVPPSLSH